MVYNVNQLAKELEKTKIRFVLNEPMSRHTSFKIGGNADIFAAASNAEEFKTLLRECHDFGVPYHIIGKGTNILVSDKGVDGVVITTEVMNRIRVDGNRITCGAGATLSSLCNTAAGHSLTGLEFAYGIPGSVGGAVYMNAGAYDGEMVDVVESAVVINSDGEISTLTREQLKFSYRSSVLRENGATVIEAVFLLKPGISEEIHQSMDNIIKRRREKQPLEFPSAGSTFKRPEGNYAGALIEGCGLKGVCVGGAMVSRKHAGFIINTGGATARDVLDLIAGVQDAVYQDAGVMLEPEIIFIGRE